MGVGGYATGGQSGTAPSRAYNSLPWKGYRELDAWFEEFVDAMALEMDVLYSRFVSNNARINLTDPTYIPTEDAGTYYGTFTAAPTRAQIQDTLLDLLCVVSGTPYPVDSNYTTEHKRALVLACAEAYTRKGVRAFVLSVVAALTDGVVYGWMNNPYDFGIVIPDGAPSPGWGSDWVRSTGALDAVFRPWLLDSIRRQIRKLAPPGQLGIGYSQFRASYSAAGEVVMPSNARLNILANEHFSSWSMGVPVSWSSTGAGTLTESTSVAYINWEFTGSAAQIDLSAAAHGVGVALDQTVTVNNRAVQRFQIDYAYTSTADHLYVIISDSTNASPGYYWNPNPVLQDGTITITEGEKRVSGSGTTFVTGGLWDNMQITTASGKTYIIDHVESTTSLVLTEEPPRTETTSAYYVTSWSTTAYKIVLENTAAVRTRYAFDVRMHRGSSTIKLHGTQQVNISFGALSEGTAASKLVYTVYRVGFYEKFDLDQEKLAGGERTLWLPLKDARGYVTFTRTAGDDIIEIANASKNKTKNLADAANVPIHSYHHTLSGRGFRSNTSWVNKLFDTGDMTIPGDFTLSNASLTASDQDNPDIVAAVSTHPRYTNSAAGSYLHQTSVVADPSSKSYMGGIWVKKTTADVGNQSGTITLTAGSAAVTGSGTSFAASWVGFSLITSVGTYKITSVTNATSLTLAAVSNTTETGVSFQLTDILVSLISNTTFSEDYVLSDDDGWKLLPLRSKTFGGGDTNALEYRLTWGPANTGVCLAFYQPYLYDVTTCPDVLYPPVVSSAAASAGTLNASKSRATSDTVGTNILHPFVKRRLASASRGIASFTFVPTYGADNGPRDGVIFDIAEDATHNRVKLSIDSGLLSLARWDDAAQTHTVDLIPVITEPASVSDITWLRDQPLAIRMVWDEHATYLSAGNADAFTATNGGWSVDDSALVAIGIGNDYNIANPIDGFFNDLEIVAIGPQSG